MKEYKKPLADMHPLDVNELMAENSSEDEVVSWLNQESIVYLIASFTSK